MSYAQRYQALLVMRDLARSINNHIRVRLRQASSVELYLLEQELEHRTMQLAKLSKDGKHPTLGDLKRQMDAHPLTRLLTAEYIRREHETEAFDPWYLGDFTGKSDVMIRDILIRKSERQHNSPKSLPVVRKPNAK